VSDASAAHTNDARPPAESTARAKTPNFDVLSVFDMVASVTRVAALCDVHGNLPALEAVLRHAGTLDGAVILGAGVAAA
jgi:hypothetical protein